MSKLDAEQKRLVTAAIKQWFDDADEGVAGKLMGRFEGLSAVSYTHLTLPTTPYV